MTDDLADFLSKRYWKEDGILRQIREELTHKHLAIQIDSDMGRALALLIQAVGAHKILEIGTLYGYSAIWMARALPETGSLETIEASPEYADRAQHWFHKAGLAKKMILRQGEASKIMPTLQGEYDIVFLDADKNEYPMYAQQATRLLKPKGLLLADNMLWQGKVADPDYVSVNAKAIRQFHTWLEEHSDVFDATVLTVGDGLLLAVRR